MSSVLTNLSDRADIYWLCSDENVNPVGAPPDKGVRFSFTSYIFESD
jgi:hypothetical protein